MKILIPGPAGPQGPAGEGGEGGGLSRANVETLTAHLVAGYFTSEDALIVGHFNTGDDAASGATITASETGTGDLASIVDGDDGTAWANASTAAGWVQFEHSYTSDIVTQYRLVATFDISLTVEHSEDGLTWNTTETLSGPVVAYDHGYRNASQVPISAPFWRLSWPENSTVSLFTVELRVYRRYEPAALAVGAAGTVLRVDEAGALAYGAVVLIDTVTSAPYRLIVTSGELGIEALS